MFSFGKKSLCDVCGISAAKTKVSDGSVCNSCFSECRYFLTPDEVINYKSLSISTLKDAYVNSKRSKEFEQVFKGTKNIDNHFFIDNTNDLWAVIDNTYNEKKLIIFSFKDVESFELMQDDESIITGGLGSAIAGGILFGEVGAIVGGIVGTKKIKKVINKFQIRVNLKDMRPYYINLLKGPGYGLSIKSGTNEYNKTINEAEKILEIFNASCTNG